MVALIHELKVPGLELEVNALGRYGGIGNSGGDGDVETRGGAVAFYEEITDGDIAGADVGQPESLDYFRSEFRSPYTRSE